MMDQEEAKKNSIETLIRTGVLDENGQTKEQLEELVLILSDL